MVAAAAKPVDGAEVVWFGCGCLLGDKDDGKLNEALRSLYVERLDLRKGGSFRVIAI